jgi:hypothetical protein
LQHIIRITYVEIHIDSSIKTLNIRHKHNNLIKEFTPLRATSPGPASNGSLLLNCSKCSKTCLTMLKMTNRLLQWLRSVPKPLSGLFRHLKRSKNEEDSLLEISLFNSRAHIYVPNNSYGLKYGYTYNIVRGLYSNPRHLLTPLHIFKHTVICFINRTTGRG